MRLRSDPLPLTRRQILQRSTLAFTAPLLGGLDLTGLVRPAAAQNAAPNWRHGLSLFGDLHYPADFKHFDYVNPNAPKGGAVRMLAVGTYDNFNVVIAGLKGQIASGINLIYNQLFTSSADEVATQYGLIADAAHHPDDFSTVTYRLRAEAKWHDGKPITPD